MTEAERDVIKLIKSKEKTFTKQQRALAEYIEKHYDKAAYMTASELGKNASASESTVVRFAASLGFDSYQSFIKSLKESARNRLKSL